MCNKQFLEVKDEPLLKNDKIWLECSKANFENDLTSLEVSKVQRMLKNRLDDPLVRYVYKNMFPNEDQSEGLDKYFFSLDKENAKPVSL